MTTKKRDYWTDAGQTDGQTDRQTPDKVIPLCCYVLQAITDLMNRSNHVGLEFQQPFLHLASGFGRRDDVP